MKKLTKLPVMFGVLLLTAVSCTKDGVYAPKSKIQLVFSSSSYTDKHLSQSWNWDGKLLNAIDFYSSTGSLSWTENFSYDGNRLTRVDDYLNSEYTTFVYDGKNLKSANYYYKGALEATAAYKYTDGKLKEMVVTEYEGDKSKDVRNLRSSVLPFAAEVTNAIEAFRASVAERNAAKGIYVITLQFTWTDDNITRIVATSEGRMQTLSLQYDTKNNPLKGFLNLYSVWMEDIDDGNLCFSKNNITSIIYNMDGENEVVNFTYQYNADNYPTMKIGKGADDDYQDFTYYEY